MSISGISATTSNSLLNTIQTDAQQKVQDLKALQTALQKGDLSAAQTAFATFQNDLSSQSGKQNQPASDSPVGQSLQALQTALQKGAVSGAQSAFATLQTAMKAGGHHHHHHAAGDSSTSTQDTATTATDTTTSQSGTGGILDALA